MKFYIAVEEMRSTVVEVEAETESEAIFKVEKAYSEDKICLNNVDYIDDGTCFYDETEKFKKIEKTVAFKKFSKKKEDSR